MNLSMLQGDYRKTVEAARGIRKPVPTIVVHRSPIESTCISCESWWMTNVFLPANRKGTIRKIALEEGYDLNYWQLQYVSIKVFEDIENRKDKGFLLRDVCSTDLEHREIRRTIREVLPTLKYLWRIPVDN